MVIGISFMSNKKSHQASLLLPSFSFTHASVRIERNFNSVLTRNEGKRKLVMKVYDTNEGVHKMGIAMDR